MADFPAHIQSDIAQHLDAIAEHFKADAKLTLLVRFDRAPGIDSDFVLTSDKLPDAIAALERRRRVATEAANG